MLDIYNIDQSYILKTEEDLERVYPSPRFLPVLEKLDRTCQLFIKQSPLVVLGTFDESVGVEVSPRGDEAGFVKIIDENTIAIPDRTGNNRLDCIRTLLKNPEIGLFFVVPGLIESLRVKGVASISICPKLLAEFEEGGKLPRSVVIVKVEEAFLHCGKAIVRSKLWDDLFKVKEKSWRLARGTLENSDISTISLSEEKLLKVQE